MRYLTAACLVAATLVAPACRRGDTPEERREGVLVDRADPPAAGSAATPQPWPIALEPLTLPVSGVTSQPHMTLSDRGLIMSWMEQRDADFSLRFAERSGARWSEPRTVASSTGWFVSEADVPTVIRMRDGTLVANTYPAVDFRLEAYDLRLTYSRDEGKTWAKALVPHHDATRTQHGFATLFELPNRRLGLVWLDGRDYEANKETPERAAMAVYYTTFDENWKQSAETIVNTRVCECCQTAVATTADGPIVAFRDRSADEVRDISVSRLEQDQWTPERPLHADNWEIDACPVNGPALSARGGTVAAAWFTAKDDQGQAFAAFSTDSGRSWSEPIRLDDGVSMGHVDIELLDDGSAAATWMEFADQHSQFRLRRIMPSGARSASITVAGHQSTRVSGYPRLAKQGDELVLAWTEGAGDGGPTQVKSVVARIPT